MGLGRENFDYKRYIVNSIGNTQYLTKNRCIKLLDSIDNPDIDKIDFKKENPKTVLLKELSANPLDLIKLIEEYEYDKYYKYFCLYRLENVDMNYIAKVLQSKEWVNLEEMDYVSDTLEKPSIRYYEDSIDIKFSKIFSTNPQYADGFKYPVIITLFTELKLVLIKYCAVPWEYNQPEFYIKIHDLVKNWIINVMKVTLIEFESFKAFQDLRLSIRDNPNEYPNVTAHLLTMDDEFNGRTSLRSTNQDELPLVDGILKIAETFSNEYDRNKLVEYIKRYENESIVRFRGIKWKERVSNSRGRLGSITVILRKMHSLDNDKLYYRFTHHHILSQDSINRERINHVIKYLSNYIGENS